MGQKYKVTEEDAKDKNVSIDKAITYTKNKLTFDKFIFKNNDINNQIENICIRYDIDLREIEFNECILYSINKLNINILSIKNSIIVDRFIIENKSLSKIDLTDSIFYSKVKIQHCEITEEANFLNASFKDLADFYRTKFNKVIFKRADFEKISVFSEVEFKEDIDFRYVKFLGKSIFRDTVIKGKLNLRNSIFDDDANFLDITSEERKKNDDGEHYGESKIINVANRETARIIKNFYDKSNNIIEANKFYALEMDKREEELNTLVENKSDVFEWLIFKIHNFSSEHSQNWFLALLWILIISFISYVVQDTKINIDEYFNYLLFWCFLIVSTIVYYINIKNITLYIAISLFVVILINFFIIENTSLNNWMQYTNPLSSTKSLDAIGFILKVIISYLIYQFIVSVRQNTRRK